MGSHKPHQLFKRITTTNSWLDCKQMGVNQREHLFAIKNGSENRPLAAGGWFSPLMLASSPLSTRRWTGEGAQQYGRHRLDTAAG